MNCAAQPDTTQDAKNEACTIAESCVGSVRLTMERMSRSRGSSTRKNALDGHRQQSRGSKPGMSDCQEHLKLDSKFDRKFQFSRAFIHFEEQRCTLQVSRKQ